MDTTHENEHAERAPAGPSRLRRYRAAVLAVVTAAAVGAAALLVDLSSEGRAPAPGTPCAEGKGERALLRCLRPSLALLETPLATGSGVLVEGRYVVTNAHVVEPFDSTTVVFAGGERHEEVPVVGVDFHADLALVGPVETERPPVEIVRGVPRRGEELFVAAYPGDVDDQPEPVIRRGVLTRTRALPELGMTFLQTDAVVADGESGGAVVDGAGRVVGVPGISIEEGRYALALSGAETLRSMARIRARQVPAYRPLPGGPGITSTTVDLPGTEHLAPLAMRAGTRNRTVRLTLPPDARPAVLVTSLDGDSLLFANQEAVEAIEEETGEPLGVEPDEPVAPGVFEFELPARTYARIELRTRLPEGTTMPVESTVPFHLVGDLDNDRRIAVGEPVHGVLDPLEVSDSYLLDLQAGETIDVFAGSAYGDVAFDVRAPGHAIGDAYVVDDSGTGLTGVDARGRFVAETSGTHRIIVVTPQWRATGYVLRVTRVAGAGS